MWNMALGLGIMVAAWAHMDPRPVYEPWHLGVFVLMILGAAAVLLGIFLALTAASFWMTDRVGILPPVYNFMQFGRYPLTIYRPWIQFLLSFILPFGFAAFYPVTFFLGRTEFLVQFGLTPLVGVGVLAIGYYIWSLGVRRYESTGT
jgi:ABC-2 type transport system permease protein